MIDMYTNYQYTEFCKDVESICEIQPNACCNNVNPSNPNRCGNGTDCLLWTENYMSWNKPGLLRFFVFMLIQFVLQFGFILFYEAGYLRKLAYKFRKLIKADNELVIQTNQLEMEEEYGDLIKDEDVVNEEIRISKMNPKNFNNKEIFIIDRLTKYYSKFMAVKGISLSLGSSECFGLLGKKNYYIFEF